MQARSQRGAAYTSSWGCNLTAAWAFVHFARLTQLGLTLDCGHVVHSLHILAGDCTWCIALMERLRHKWVCLS